MSVYTDSELDQYLAHVGLLPLDHASARERARQDPLGFLTLLQRRQMGRVPFENLSLHYARHRTLSLDPADLFAKMVGAGRGGYCMEVNRFFATVLRSLGYTLFSVGGRVCTAGVFGGWNHMLNIVTIDGVRYAVDVGFGSNGAPQPMRLEHGHEFDTVAPARGRLEHRALAAHSDPAQRVWVYSGREHAEAEWTPLYAFVEVEFFPADFEVMNLATMTSPRSFFVQTVICMRTLLDETTGRPNGLLILHKDYVKRRRGGEAAILETLATEEDRVRALKEHFGIELSEDEQKAIRGLATELRPSGGHA